MRTKSTAGTRRTTGKDCTCPACSGLQSFESPRYATGALLSADDLSSEQAYVRAKMRLQNRHLHGWGMVCGLKVVCDDCEGSVRILPGYALDPCGNDLVLPDATRFDIARAIRDCRNAKRRSRTGDCDPFVPGPDPGCAEVETHWCVTLRFREVESGHAVSLAQQKPAATGCGCGGSDCRCGGGGGAGCSCGGRGGVSGGVVAGAPGGQAGAFGYVLPGCTPRRLVECVEIGVAEHAGPCGGGLWSRDPDRKDKRGGWDALAPPGSLLGRLLACGREALAVLRERLTEADLLALSVFSGETPDNVAAQDVHDALCRLRQALLDFLMRHDPVRCGLLRDLDALRVPRPQAQDGRDVEPVAAYADRTAAVAQALLSAWIQAAVDCACDALLPPCPEDPCDDRVPIACVTMRGDRIVSICNHSCRRHAGAFPTWSYWLSALPIGALLQQAIAAFCCTPVTSLLRPERDDPRRGYVATRMTAGGFAAPRALLRGLEGIDLPGAVAAMAGGLATADFAAIPLGQAPDSAMAGLAARGVRASVVEVTEEEAEAAARNPLGALGAALGGGPVRLMVHAGRVVGMEAEDGGVLASLGQALGGRRPAVAAAAPPAEDLAAMRAELDALRARIARLDPGGGP